MSFPPIHHPHRQASVFGCLGALAVALSLHTAHGQVAVFVDPDWSTLSRNDVVPAPLIADILGAHMAVTRLSAEGLADPARLDATKLPVLVLPDTDALPEAALPALQAFRRAGGCLVWFREPLAKVATRAAAGSPDQPRWTTSPATEAQRADAAGILLLRTAGTVRHDRPCTRTVPQNPLGITPAMLASSLPNQQRLDPKSLPAGDQLIPLVTVEQEGAGPALPIAAAIKRRCPEANGACDVWLGQTCWNLDTRERWFAEQLLVRGVLWCLQEKRILPPTDVAAADAKLDSLPKPDALPANLPIERSPRPWGDSLVPRSPAPASRLAAVDLSKLPPDERAALCCLQGLTSRRQPSIWLLRSGAPHDQDRFWLDEHVRQGAIDGYDLVADWAQLVKTHAAEIKGAIVADPACDRGDVIAMNLAACEDLLLCTPALAEKLGLPVKVDLRGRFATYLDGMEWVWQTYRDRFSRHALNYFHPARLAWGNVDQCYQWRIPLVWTAYKDDAFAKGADPAREHDLVARMLAAMDTHSVVMGWPSFGPRLGVDEYIAVMQATPYSHGYVPSDGLANMSVMAGAPLPPVRQPAQPAAPSLEAGKIYASLVISDGDNLSPWMDYFRQHYFAPDSPELPLGITVGPTIREAMPAATRWYFEQARAGVEFVCGVSGATYVSPEVFGTRLADREAAWNIFFADTTRSMTALGLATLNISPRGEPLADRYARALPFCHSIINSWNRRGDDPEGLVERLPSGKPAFWSSTPGTLTFHPPATEDGGAAMARAFYTDLDLLVGRKLAAGEPVLVSSVISCWEWKKEPLRQLVAQKPDHVVFVTPTQLAALAKRVPKKPEGAWIGFNQPVERQQSLQGAESKLDWKGVGWIWTGEARSATDPAAAGQRVFRWNVRLPDARAVTIRTAWVRLTGDDRADLFINGHRRCEATNWAKPVEREVTEYLRPGPNVIGIAGRNGGGPAGWALKIVIEFDDGFVQELTPGAGDVLWTDSADADGKWAAPETPIASWKSAVRLGDVGIAPWGSVAPGGFFPGSNQSAPAPLLRKTFTVDKPVKQATLQSSGLGCHVVSMNGTPLDDAVLGPAMTQYDKTVLYTERDVTRLVQPGRNAIGVMLGHGWFAETVKTAWNFDQSPWKDRPKLLVTLRIEYADGSEQTITSDESWRAAYGPVLVDAFMNGEVYDARKEWRGWDTPAFDDSAWAYAERMKPPAGMLRPEALAPMRVTATLPAVKLTQTRPGVWLYDFGENISGWARLRVRGPAGTEIRLRFGEQLRDGRIERELGGLIWSGWFQQDRYTLRGDGSLEEWEPRFTYHGFRYVEVEGWPGTPEPSSVEARFVHTDFPSAGSFECSDPLVNAIHAAIRRSYRGNFHGFPTDCPTREKKGWTGDAHLACAQAMFNFDNAAGYRKWMGDFLDVQDKEGRLKVVCPTAGWGGEASDWNVAAVVIPWTVYEFTADRTVVAASYPMMQKWANYHARTATDFIIKDGVSDWSPAKTRTPREITSTCFYHGALERLARMADVLGKTDDAARYRALAASVREAFVKAFVQPDGTVGAGSQAAQACALHFGLLPEHLRKPAAGKLSAAVTAAKDHVDVGILGAKALFRALSDHGHHEQAMRVVCQKTAPGYGWMIEKGCTTLTEDWWGGGSHNHIMFGDIGAWFYEYLAGIRPDPDQPGFKHFVLQPMPAGDLTYVRAEHRSPHGMVRAAWERRPDGSYVARFTVPQHTTATVILPDGHRKEAGAGDHEFSWTTP